MQSLEKMLYLCATMLLPYLIHGIIEAGCDEAGRGPLAGSVFAAAVILPKEFQNIDAVAFGESKPISDKWLMLNDSKQLTEHQRNELRVVIENEAAAWAVAEVTAEEIDRINILNASILAMHKALDRLAITPQHIIVDGNRFKPWTPQADEQNLQMCVPHRTIVKGDAKYMAIAAASILAKTHRDEYMRQLHLEYPQYGWDKNMGYPTADHRKAIKQYGLTPYHRKTFRH